MDFLEFLLPPPPKKKSQATATTVKHSPGGAGHDQKRHGWRYTSTAAQTRQAAIKKIDEDYARRGIGPEGAWDALPKKAAYGRENARMLRDRKRVTKPEPEPEKPAEFTFPNDPENLAKAFDTEFFRQYPEARKYLGSDSSPRGMWSLIEGSRKAGQVPVFAINDTYFDATGRKMNASQVADYSRKIFESGQKVRMIDGTPKKAWLDDMAAGRLEPYKKPRKRKEIGQAARRWGVRLKHKPGGVDHNQKRHGWRYGSLGAARRSVRGERSEGERGEYYSRATRRGVKITPEKYTPPPPKPKPAPTPAPEPAATGAAAPKKRGRPRKTPEGTTPTPSPTATAPTTPAAAKLTPVEKDAAELESKLRNNAIKVVADPTRTKGAFVSETVDIEGDGKGIAKATSKTPKGTESKYESEVAAYEVAKAMGIDTIPLTVARNVPGMGVVSVQAYVTGAKSGWESGRDLGATHLEDLGNITMLDMVIANLDRHGGNVLFTDGRLVSIDHGMAFSDWALTQDNKTLMSNAFMKTSRNSQYFKDKVDGYKLPITQDVLDNLKKTTADGTLKQTIMATGLSERVANQAVARAQYLSEFYDKYFYISGPKTKPMLTAQTAGKRTPSMSIAPKKPEPAPAKTPKTPKTPAAPRAKKTVVTKAKTYSATRAADAHADFHADSGWQEWLDGLSTSEVAALRAYVGRPREHTTYKALNSAMRSGTLDTSGASDLARTYRGMASAVEKGSLHTNAVLWRSMDLESYYRGAMDGTIKPGGTFTDKAFISTSPKKGTATGSFFTKRASYPVLWKIKAGKGTKGAYTSWDKKLANPYMHESEFIMKPGSNFRIDKVKMEYVAGRYTAVFEVTALPEGATKERKEAPGRQRQAARRWGVNK